jgi:hypothetical protein
MPKVAKVSQKEMQLFLLCGIYINLRFFDATVFDWTALPLALSPSQCPAPFRFHNFYDAFLAKLFFKLF